MGFAIENVLGISELMVTLIGETTEFLAFSLHTIPNTFCPLRRLPSFLTESSGHPISVG